LTEQTNNQQTFDLLVVDGQHEGARAPLAVEGVTSVGTGLDCDIVLASAATDLTHTRVDISQEHGQCKILVLEGSVGVGQDTAQVGDELPVPLDARISLGDSVFSLVPNSAVQAQANATVVATPVKKRSQFTTLAATAVIGLCFVVAGVASFLAQQQKQPPVVEAEQVSVESLLSGSEFAGVEVAMQDDGEQTLIGRVAKRADHIQLKSLLSTAGLSPALNVTIDEVFVEDVAAIYRLNGVEASIEMNGPGEVTVKTGVADDPFLEEVEARAYQDVPELVTLNRVNTPPPVKEPEPERTFNELPGKRIKMVVANDPAFILTEDGSRYFIGAILPSGYKIKSIFEKTVQLERDNEIVDLVF